MIVSLRDVRFETFTNASNTIYMKLTHLPTGTFVEGNGVLRLRLKENLFSKLKDKINDIS